MNLKHKKKPHIKCKAFCGEREGGAFKKGLVNIFSERTRWRLVLGLFASLMFPEENPGQAWKPK